MKEINFYHGNICIRQTWSPLGKHVEVIIKNEDRWEIINRYDKRATEAFIALHNKRCKLCYKKI